MKVDVEKILEIIPVKGGIKLKEIEEKIHYAPSTIRGVLRKLIKEGKIISAYDLKNDMRGLKYRRINLK